MGLLTRAAGVKLPPTCLDTQFLGLVSGWFTWECMVWVGLWRGFRGEERVTNEKVMFCFLSANSLQ